jgi:hypothetical protein
MNTLRTFAAGVVLAVSFPGAGWCWGTQGHQAIGAMADQLLNGSNAQTHVQQLLQGQTLEKYSIWADCAKGYCQDWRDDEMSQYVIANPQHAAYHYTDIPIQEVQYSETSVGASPNDIVHIMRQCIEVLRGNDNADTNPHGFSPRIALILLAHFVGDIHQPLHVGAAYVADDEKYVDPDIPGAQYADTRGGNYVQLMSSANVHAYWDTNAVKRAMTQAHAQTPEQYAAAILTRPEPDNATSGDVADWPQRWADQAVPVAAQAYMQLELAARHTVPDGNGGHAEWDVAAKPDNYTDLARDASDRQIAKAGYRLAALLKRIWP